MGRKTTKTLTQQVENKEVLEVDLQMMQRGQKSRSKHKMIKKKIVFKEEKLNALQKDSKEASRQIDETKNEYTNERETLNFYNEEEESNQEGKNSIEVKYFQNI